MNAFTRHWDIVKAALAHEKERAGSALRVDETDFLPAALEIIERPVSPTARLTSWVLLVGLALTIGWLVVGRLDVVASAPGQIIPAQNVKLGTPNNPGVIRPKVIHCV